MGTILVKDLFFRVSSQLQDLSPQFTRWTQREFVDSLNDGQKAIAKYMPWSCARIDSVKLKPGTRQSIESIAASDIIAGDGSPAAAVTGTVLQSVIRNMGSNGSTPGRAVRVVDREILDINTPDWHGSAAAATPIAAFVFDPRTPKVFYVSPGIPAVGTWWAELSFLADPVTIVQAAEGTYGKDGASVATISVDDKYVDDLLNYILARAFMKDAEYASNPGLASAYTTLFTASINAQAAAVTGVNPNLQSLPFNPNVPKKA